METGGCQDQLVKNINETLNGFFYPDIPVPHFCTMIL